MLHVKDISIKPEEIFSRTCLHILELLCPSFPAIPSVLFVFSIYWFSFPFFFFLKKTFTERRKFEGKNPFNVSTVFENQIEYPESTSLWAGWGHCGHHTRHSVRGSDSHNSPRAQRVRTWDAKSSAQTAHYFVSVWKLVKGPDRKKTALWKKENHSILAGRRLDQWEEKR